MNKVLIIAMLSLMSPQVMAAWTRLEGAPDTGVNVYANVGKVRMLVSSLYTGQMGSGKVVKLTGNASPWLPVEPNSLAVVLWKTACGKQTIERHL